LPGFGKRRGNAWEYCGTRFALLAGAEETVMTLLTTVEKQEKPIRAGVFTSLSATQNAVSRLLAGGFTKAQITVICSDEAKEQYFREFEHQKPAGAITPAAAAIGGTLGAALGGITVAAGLALGGLPVVIVGGAFLMTGSVVGGFLGAMMTRGVEKEAANYYDQAVAEGKLLVAVECHADDAEKCLGRAERILAEAGAQAAPLPLAEG
jgi:hypothetical protein